MPMQRNAPHFRFGKYMFRTTSEAAFEVVAFQLAQKPGVTRGRLGLLIDGVLFAFLHGDRLVIEVSQARTTELKMRGDAASLNLGIGSSRNWVQVCDMSLWHEVTRESMRFVHDSGFRASASASA